MTYARVPHRNYWHSSDVKPEGFTELRANNCGVARALAYVITNLWYELTCLHGYRDVHLRVINFRSEMAFSVTQAVVSKSILEEAENSSIDWWSIPEELVIPRDMLEKFGRYDDVDVNVLMSDEDKENLEPLSKREDRREDRFIVRAYPSVLLLQQ